MTNKFWDIEHFLLHEENIYCTTKEDIMSLGILEEQNSNQNITIAKNTRLKVPLWAGLTLSAVNAVTINEPLYLSSKFYSQLSTDSIIINMKNKQTYFYDLCLILIPELFKMLHDWTNLIWNAMVDRYIHLYKNSKQVMYENYSLLKSLCYREKEFYLKMVEINENIQAYLKDYNKINKVRDKIDVVTTRKTQANSS